MKQQGRVFECTGDVPFQVEKESSSADLLTSPPLFIAQLGWMSRYCNEAEREAQFKGQRSSRCGSMIKRLFFLPSDG